MKTSVVLVVHPKYQKYLGTALKSLSRLTDSAEVIIVNNGDSASISDEIDAYSQFREVVCAPLPLAAACNLGISESTGEYIIRVDADDWISPELIGVEQHYLDSHDVDAVWCDYLHASEAMQAEGVQLYSLEIAPQTELEHACGAMYRRQVWEDLGGYDESLRFQEAFDFWSRFKLAGFRADRIDAPMYYYRKHQGSMSTNPEREDVRRMLERKYQT